MNGLDERDREAVGRLFHEEIDAARGRMRIGDGSGGRGLGCIWTMAIGGVDCGVNFSWFARMEERSGGGNMVVGECIVDIFMVLEMAEIDRFLDSGEEPERSSGLAALSFEYADGEAMGGFDHWRHFEATFEAAKECLETAPRYLALREARELDACLPGARSERKGRL